MDRSQPRLWQRQQFGDFYAMGVAGSARRTIDGIAVSPILSPTENPGTPEDVRLSAYTQQRPAPAEFRADQNDAPGGLGIWASPSGTPHWHGQFYGIPRLYFLQPAASDSSGAIRYRSNRYGGSAAGPLKKISTFVYADYLGIDQEVDRWLIGYVPSGSLRAHISAAEPELAPIVDAYPSGGFVSSPGLLESRATGTQKQTDQTALLRLDHSPRSDRAKNQGSWYGRFSMAFVDNQVPLGGNDGYLRDLNVQRNHPMAVVLGWEPPETAHGQFQFRAAWMRGMLRSQIQSPLQLPYTVAIPGFTTLNGNRETVATSETVVLQANVIRTHRRHTIAAGGEVRRIRMGLQLTDFGRINFASVATFSANRVNTASYNQAVPANTLGQWQHSVWIEDGWQARPNLRLALGLRYDLYTTLHESGALAVPFDFTTCGDAGFCAPGASFNTILAQSLDPRASIAWTPSTGPDWLRSKVVVRAGAAIYHANGLLMDQSQPVYNEVPVFSLTSTPQNPLSYPLTPYFASNASGVASARGMSRQRRNPYAEEWSASIQSQIARRWSATATYFGANGVHLPTSTYINLIVPAGGSRPHPSFGQIGYLENTSSSSLHVFALTALASLPGNGLILGGYNWGHEIDDGASSDIGADAPQDPACPRCERASGDQDIRQLGGVRTYNPLPIRPMAGQQRRTRWINRIMTDWSLLNDFYATSALPVNVTIDRRAATVPTGYIIRQRPDRVPGVSLRPAGGPSVSQWINPAAFTTVSGLYGTTPRNVARGPAHWALNSGLQKSVQLPHGFHANVLLRAQNVLNHANYAQPLTDWSAPQFGRIVNPYGPALAGDAGPRSFSVDLSFSR